MPSNKRQRELARARAERQAARRAAERAVRRRKRTILGLSVGGVALVAVLLLVLLMSRDDKKSTVADDPNATPTPTASASPPPTACGAQTPPAAKPQKFEAEPKLAIDAKKTYTATMKTSCGVISFSMDAAKAPRTVNSLQFLAGKKFYDGSFCHRMTSGGTLTVLQCGDPTGTGGGDIGYTLPEENLAGATYKRGTVAMAKTQAPNSTGSQFFLVGKDSQLPPEYTIVGQMTPDSLKVLDKIMAIGIEGDAPDGAPKQRVYIETFTVAVK